MSSALHLAHVTAEGGFSGGEVQLFLLLEGLRKRGHRNLLVCPPASRSEEEARRRGFEVTALRMRSDWSLLAAARLMRRLRAAKPDIVHLHSGRATWLGGLAAAGASLPALATRRMDRPVRPGPRNQVLRSTLRHRVAISDAIARQLADGGIPPTRIRVVPSAVDPSQLQPRRERSEVRRELLAGDDELCLLAVAALVRRKGLDVLLGALPRLGRDDLHPTLWIAGEGPLRRELEELARRADVADRVRFLGRRDDVPDLLAACDAFVLPSRHEGLGVAALEAMTAGRPVVATRVGGLAEAVVHERTGLLVPPDDADALAEALARLLQDPELRRRLAAAGPGRIAERFTAEAMVDAYEHLYREMLAEGARP